MDTKELNALKRRYNIIGFDPKLMAALERAVIVAPVDMSVLVIGENGAGKEFFPRIIHDQSSRSKKPYFAINCGALPEGTINSELFGHVKGAFTDAVSDHKGYFETTDGGTLFLDEVAELPLETQARLLRVLETGEFIKMGSSKVQKTNVRIVAATNKDLRQEIAAGRFREDLYYRLAQVIISVPPLRERGDDILLLFERFSSDFASEHKLQLVTLDNDAKEQLKRFSWPGNVRQLKNTTEQIALFEAGNTIDSQTLHSYLPNSDLVAVGNATFSYEHDREIIFSLIGQLSSEVNRLKQLFDPASDQAPITASESLLLNPPVADDARKRSLAVPNHIAYTNLESLQREPFFKEVNQENEAELVAAEEYHEPHREPTLKDMEEKTIADELHRQGGNRKRTAAVLGISERTLYRKIKKYELK